MLILQLGCQKGHRVPLGLERVLKNIRAVDCDWCPPTPPSTRTTWGGVPDMLHAVRQIHAEALEAISLPLIIQGG